PAILLARAHLLRAAALLGGNGDRAFRARGDRGVGDTRVRRREESDSVPGGLGRPLRVLSAPPGRAQPDRAYADHRLVVSRRGGRERDRKRAYHPLLGCDGCGARHARLLCAQGRADRARGAPGLSDSVRMGTARRLRSARARALFAPSVARPARSRAADRGQGPHAHGVSTGARSDRIPASGRARVSPGSRAEVERAAVRRRSLASQRSSGRLRRTERRTERRAGRRTGNARARRLASGWLRWFGRSGVLPLPGSVIYDFSAAAARSFDANVRPVESRTAAARRPPRPGSPPVRWRERSSGTGTPPHGRRPEPA